MSGSDIKEKRPQVGGLLKHIMSMARVMGLKGLLLMGEKFINVKTTKQ